MAFHVLNNQVWKRWRRSVRRPRANKLLNRWLITWLTYKDKRPALCSRPQAFRVIAELSRDCAVGGGLFALIYIWFILRHPSTSSDSSSAKSSSSTLDGSGGGCSRFHPRKSERSARDEEANFYKNGMKIKTSEGIMD